MFRIVWFPILITGLAVAGYVLEWPVEVLAPALIIILAIGLMGAAIGGRDRKAERSWLKLKQLAGYFNRRFAGNSSLSIFAITDALYSIDNPRLWEWARGCDMAQRVFNTWCDSFASRLESDAGSGRYGTHLRTHLNELWQMNSRYYEFVEQFHEVAEKAGLPEDVATQYNRFALEYNAFVQDFRGFIGELKRVARTELEPPGVKLASELTAAKPPPPPKEEKPRLPEPPDHKGYIL